MRYRIASWKNLVILLVFAIIIIGGIFAWKKFNSPKEDTRSVFEALVQVADQTVSNPDEDKRSSLKRGDVIAVFPEGHPWSDTEKSSYLIVKIKTTQESANKLLEPVTKEIKREKKEGEQDMGPEVETVRPRRYYLDIDVPTVNELMTKGQPYKDKVFGEGVIEER